MATQSVRTGLDAAIARIGTELGEQLERALDGLRDELDTALAAQVGASDGSETLREALAVIDRAADQANVLSRFLEQSQSFAPRVAFLLLSEESLRVWDSRGFEGSLQSRDVERSGSLEPLLASPGSHPLDETRRRLLAEGLQIDSPVGACVVPFALRGHTRALLYADTTDDADAVDMASLQILTHVAAQTLDLISLRTGTNSAFGRVAAAPQAPAPAPEPVAAPPDTGATTSGAGIHVGGRSASPVTAEPEEAAATEAAAEAPAPAPPTQPVAPPPGVSGPGSAFQDANSDDASMHEEAQRIARLLVSEIELYNQEEIQAGRRDGTLYKRLEEDIERSRKIYEERVDDRIRDSIDHFQAELVRVLADGDESLLRA